MNFFEEIKERKSPYIIAELGSNHNGDMELAKKLILEAKNAGADCIKFQSWSKDTIFSKAKYDENNFIGDDYRDRDDYTLEEIVEEFSISEAELIDMKSFSDDMKISCTSTPFSKKEVDFLVNKMESTFIKVASMDLNNYPFLDYIARKNLPIILSTGLSDLSEIDRAVRCIEDAGNKEIIILHCVAVYPPKDEDVNLNNIQTLKKAYPDYPIGFSDHTLGVAIPLAATALGVSLIEKHFTLDKDMFGWDHKVSATPDELKIICEETKRISVSLGSFRVKSVEGEERKQEFRRSIVLTRDMSKGDIIKVSDIDYKRPGTGLKPEFTDMIIGRTINKNLKYDHILSEKDMV